MLTEQHREECLSRAHIEAVAAAAGIIAEFRNSHDYGIDGTFRPIHAYGKRYIEAGFPIDFQAKATINWEKTDTHVRYKMEVKAFNDLVERAARPTATPLILVLLLLPPDRAEWHRASEDGVLLKHALYWERLSGAFTDNKKTETIHIERSQHLTPDVLRALIKLREEGKL